MRCYEKVISDHGCCCSGRIGTEYRSVTPSVSPNIRPTAVPTK